MFGKNKSVSEAPESNDESVAAAPKVGKGAPTPTRKEQEAARKRPLVPEDRTLARAAEKQRRFEEQQKVRAALNTGDERYLPLRDKGPQKRLVRNVVDSHIGVTEYSMIAVLVIVFASVGVPIQFQPMVQVAFFVVIAIILIESAFLWFRIRRLLLAKFGEIERGSIWYGMTRNLQFRKLRLPKPQVRRGQPYDVH